MLVFVEKLIGEHCNVVSAYSCSLTRSRVKLCQKSVCWASRENWDDAKRLMGKSSFPSFFASEGKTKNKKEKKERKNKEKRTGYVRVSNR